MKKIIFGVFIIIMLLWPVAAQANNDPGGFIDVNGHWAEQYINAVHELGLLHGTGLNEQGYKIFGPDEMVTRSQLAVVIQTAFNLDNGKLQFIKQPQASDYFSDVENDAWYASALTKCVLNHVVDISDKFFPEQEVTRIEVARAIYRSVNARGLDIPMIMLMPSYQDMEGLSQEDTNALVFASNTGLMHGDGQFWYPKDNIKRSELARIMLGLVNMLGVDESFDGQEYYMNPGDSLVLMLPSNPSTGYAWMSSFDEKILKLQGESFKADGNDNLAVGQGGMDLWRFKAEQLGSTDIVMTYSRSWESVQPLKVFKLKLIVTGSEAVQGELVISK